MDYKDTNQLRYEKIDYEDVEHNMYAAINPVGNYSYYIGYRTIRWFIRCLHSHTSQQYSSLRILDVGCGDGHITRMMAELVGSGKNISGFDYSENNVLYSMSMNPSVSYERGDITQSVPFPGRFDGITAFVVLSHLRKEEDVKKALANIYDALEDGGLFLWYELISKSHYINIDKDTQGFNTREMKKLTDEAGFVEIARRSFSKTIWLGKRSRSIYLYAKENNIWLLELLTRVLPLRPTITIRIYKKRELGI